MVRRWFTSNQVAPPTVKRRRCYRELRCRFYRTAALWSEGGAIDPRARSVAFNAKATSSTRSAACGVARARAPCANSVRRPFRISATTRPTCSGSQATAAPCSTAHAWFNVSWPRTAPTKTSGRPAAEAFADGEASRLGDDEIPRERPAPACSIRNRRHRPRYRGARKFAVRGATSVGLSPQTMSTATRGTSAREWSTRVTGPTPKPPLVTKMRSGAPGASAATGRARAKCKANGGFRYRRP